MQNPITETECALWHTRAALYELLALSFSYPEDLALAKALSQGEYQQALQEIAQVLEIPLSAHSLNQMDIYIDKEAEAIQTALRREYTRLFIGAPQGLVSPYEGIWRAKAEGVEPLMFVNPHSMAVKRFINNCGMDQVEGRNEPLDHIATELEFMQYLAMLQADIAETPSDVSTPKEGWASVHDRFIKEHAGTWIPSFTDAVTAESKEGFFIGAAGLLKKAIGI